jgi:hypothetical protein
LVALVLLSECGGGTGNRFVIDEGGITTEKDMMIYEAVQNTR